ncbi:hypothetical protein ACI3PL_29460, partial [Lacticaseibacillus paracasei]
KIQRSDLEKNMLGKDVAFIWKYANFDKVHEIYDVLVCRVSVPLRNYLTKLFSFIDLMKLCRQSHMISHRTKTLVVA